MTRWPAPYWVFKVAFHDVDLASIAGGNPQPDPKSLDQDISKIPSLSQRFSRDLHAQAKLENTTAISNIDPHLYDAIFLAGGHGTMWDFPDNAALSGAIATIFERGGTVGAVCHGPAGLVNVKTKNGDYLVKGSNINAFTNAEEKSVGLDFVVPFLTEDVLKLRGAHFECAANFTSFAVQDGRIITGQNPQSAERTASRVVSVLKEVEREAA